MDQSYTCNVSISYINNSNLILLILIFKVIKMCGGYLSGEIFIFLFFFLLMGKRMGNETKFQRFFLIFFVFLQCNFSWKFLFRIRDNVILKIKTSLLQDVFSLHFCTIKVILKGQKTRKDFLPIFPFSFLSLEKNTTLRGITLMLGISTKLFILLIFSPILNVSTIAFHEKMLEILLIH